MTVSRQQRHAVLRRTVVAAALVLTAACGTTVPMHNGQPVVVASDGTAIVAADGMTVGEGAGEPGTGPGEAVVSGGGGSTAPVSGAGGAPGTTGAAGAAPGGAPQPGTGGGGKGGGGSQSPGLTADTIRVGLEYTSDTSEANQAIGTNVSGGNPRANYDALIDHYNRHGGIAGRKIVPEYYEYSAQREIPPQQGPACAHFTQDKPVFAVLVLQANDNYLSCLAKGGVGAWGSESMTAADDHTFARQAGFVMPSALSLTQVARVYPPGLKKSGFFKPEAVDGSTKVGLLTFDDPRYRRAAEQVFEPALNAVGEELDQRAYVHYATTLDQVGQMSAEVSSAVLQFRQNGIDHVTIIEESALIAFAFMNAADRQNYRPQYGFNSTSGGQTFIDLDLAPREQFVNARLVAWQPLFDLPPRYAKPWPAQQQCDRMYRDAGVRFSDGNARGIAMLSCAGFSFLKAALAAAPKPISVASIPLGAERLGTSWQSPWNKVTRFGPRRHYGTSQYLTAAYDKGCHCYKPNSGMQPIR